MLSVASCAYLFRHVAVHAIMLLPLVRSSVNIETGSLSIIPSHCYTLNDHSPYEPIYQMLDDQHPTQYTISDQIIDPDCIDSKQDPLGLVSGATMQMPCFAACNWTPDLVTKD